MNEKIRSQILDIRNSGAVNMFLERVGKVDLTPFYKKTKNISNFSVKYVCKNQIIGKVIAYVEHILSRTLFCYKYSMGNY